MYGVIWEQSQKIQNIRNTLANSGYWYNENNTLLANWNICQSGIIDTEEYKHCETEVQSHGSQNIKKTFSWIVKDAYGNIVFTNASLHVRSLSVYSLQSNLNHWYTHVSNVI